MRGESVEMDEGKGLGHLQQMFFTGKTTKSLPKVGKKAAKRFAKSAAKAAKEARKNQFKVKTKGDPTNCNACKEVSVQTKIAPRDRVAAITFDPS